ncbi:class I SAM-dependent methyltransferase [Hansschlegelia zhihuaiae]|uniref:Class I SAM-dependent methyltransferase n=1 Tax=Hansschlegelia zhihuaiae TaxID=405005 RepID=A0A4Q0MGZ0_9HYPH|nr:class I SAM-dependent methyltransferase [Hansschlegelia zhihuaiae]RXF72841.1 class I SAM-dependent methyltransferase [Hansschlegelia zhihuaiae]
MSGFDPGWLDLREPADHRSVAAEPLARFRRLFGAVEPISVADLGAGSGSTLRLLAPHLGPRQRWTLVDHDPALLAHARTRLSAWADAVRVDGDRLRLLKDDKAIEVATAVCDLARDPLPDPAAACDVVVASALFDLVGERWLGGFVQRLSDARRPLYARLTYDGRKSFDPPHALDGPTLAAFNAHQQTDKGFGPSLGPAAGDRLAALAEAANYDVVEGASPWLLGPGDAALVRSLAEGMAGAAREAGAPLADLGDWLDFRRSTAASGRAEVGHVDQLLVPRLRSSGPAPRPS